jgi:hypothetical protein
LSSLQSGETGVDERAAVICTEATGERSEHQLCFTPLEGVLYSQLSGFDMLICQLEVLEAPPGRFPVLVLPVRKPFLCLLFLVTEHVTLVEKRCDRKWGDWVSDVMNTRALAWIANRIWTRCHSTNLTLCKIEPRPCPRSP